MAEALIKALEERAQKLETKIKGLTGEDGELKGSESRSKFERMMGEMHGLEETIKEAKDAELADLRSRVLADHPEEERKDAKDSAFRSFLRMGDDRMPSEERASLSAGTDANGGYLVPENTHASMLELARKNNPILRMATQFNLTGSASIELPYKATHGAVANAGETGARSEQNAPTVGNNTLTCYDYYTDQRATQLYLDEVANSETMLMQWIYDDIAEQAEADAVNGDGSTKCSGMFAHAGYKVMNTAADAVVTASDMIDQYFKLGASYRSNAVWLCNSGVMAAIAKMTHPAASATIPFATWSGDGSMMVLGRRVEEAENAPTVAKDAFPIAFADVARAYAAGFHKQTSILRDPYTATPKIRFYAYARIGGRPWDDNACCLLKATKYVAG